MSNRRSGGGFVNNRGNRYFDNNQGGGGRVVQNHNRGNSMGNQNNHLQQQGGWRQGTNQNRQSVGPQGGGGGMNAFDNRQFHHQQQQQQQQMMNQNQFQNQLSNAVLRNSVGPNPGMMSSFGGNQDQPVVMVLPQSQATGGMMGQNMNNMGGFPQSQNPFAAAVMNQQKPMQVIVGNLPAGLNPAAFGQQVLPAYGQGVGEQNMGMFGQQTQQGSNRFGRDNKNSSDRGRIQRNQKVALVRRTDVNDRGRVTTPRGVAKKRGVPVREPYGDNKKAKTVVAQQQQPRNRVALPIRKGLKNRRLNKAAPGNKAAAKPAAKDAAKTEKTATPNGNAAAATAEGDAKPAETTTEPAAPEEKKPSKYEEVPVELLVCKICQKTSSDAAAFDAHLASKVHVNLLKILEEKFTKRAELLMYESKMCEDEIAVAMDRPRRAGKGPHGGKGNKHHCKMCDCNYTVNWGTHKQSVWHRTLKEFLHPNCRFCKSQFVHRRDWVEHIVSVAHMKKLLELKQEGKLLNSDLESTAQEELFAVHIEVNKEEKPLNIVNFHSLGGRQPLTDDIKDILAGPRGEIVLPEGEIKIPEQYDENVSVGEDTVFLVGGSCCRVCRMYVNDGEQETHCKSRQHFDCYAEYLRRIVKLREQKEEDERKAKEEAEQKAKAEAEAAVKAAEEAAKAAEAAAVKKEESTESAEKKDVAEQPKSATASPSKTTQPEQMEVEQVAEKTAVAAAGQKADELVVLEEADGEEAEPSVEKMEEDQPVAETVSTPAKAAAEPAKPAAASPTTPKTPQRGGQNNRGARGSPARGGRGGPNRGAGGYRGGRGGQQQQQQTPARNATPRVDSNMRGGRGGQARGGGGRGGARGSPGRGRGRGGW